MTTKTRRKPGDGEATSAPAAPTPDVAPAEAGVRDVQASLSEMEARCAQLEIENQRLKLLVADLSLRNEALKLVVAKKF